MVGREEGAYKRWEALITFSLRNRGLFREGDLLERRRGEGGLNRGFRIFTL